MVKNSRISLRPKPEVVIYSEKEIIKRPETRSFNQRPRLLEQASHRSLKRNIEFKKYTESNFNSSYSQVNLRPFKASLLKDQA